MAKNNGSTEILIKEMKEMLNNKASKKLTLESVIWGEDGEEMMDNQPAQPEGGMPNDSGMPTEGGMPAEGGMSARANVPQQQAQGQMVDGENQTNPLDEDPEVAKLITNIRVSTLEGLRKLAQTPESAQYELLKKIFLLVDKAVEDKVNPEK